MFAVFGVALMLLVASFDCSRLRGCAAALYVSMIGLILFVLVVGGATRGSRRWIELPFFRVQPSEIGKLLLMLALSASCSTRCGAAPSTVTSG